MRSFVLTCLVVLLAAPTWALSCGRWDVARIYANVAAADEAYVIVYGTLEFDPSLLPEDDKSAGRLSSTSTRLPARLAGTSLGLGGFTHSFDRMISLEVECHGPWCAHPTPGDRYLAFVQRVESKFETSVGPCGGLLFQNPSQKQLDVLRQCIRTNSCETR